MAILGLFCSCTGLFWLVFVVVMVVAIVGLPDIERKVGKSGMLVLVGWNQGNLAEVTGSVHLTSLY